MHSETGCIPNFTSYNMDNQQTFNKSTNIYQTNITEITFYTSVSTSLQTIS